MKSQTGRGLFRFVAPSGPRTSKRHLHRSSAVVLLTIGSAALLQMPGIVGFDAAGALTLSSFTFSLSAFPTSTVPSQGGTSGGGRSTGGQAAAQKITFTSSPPTNPNVGGTYTVSATGGGSGNPVSFSIDASSTSGACSISGSSVSFTGAGTCVIDANQAAKASYSAAPQVQQSVSITGPSVVGTATTYVSSKTTTAQTSIPTGTGAGDVLVSLINTKTTTTVTCPAGWTLAYAAVNGSSTQLVSCVYSVASSTPTAKATLSSAAPVAMITTAFSGINPTNPIVAAGASKGLVPPSVTAATGDLLVVGEGSNASRVSPTAPAGTKLLSTLTNSSNSQSAVATKLATSSGSVSLAAWSTQPSTSTAVTGLVALIPSTATPSTPTPTVSPQTITFTSNAPTNPMVGGTYTVSATGGGSGNPVSFSIDASSSLSACSISGSTVSLTGAGTCVIDANQAATVSYSAAPQVQQSLTIVASSSPPPASSDTAGFSQMTPGSWTTMGQDYGGWTPVFNGYGSIGVTADPGVGNVLTLSPEAATAPSLTHSALVTSAAIQGDLDFSVEVQTVKQLRQGSAPNPWEVGWVLWHYTDNSHFYYFILKPNGWELGKEDPAYPGNQRFLATGSSPALTVGTWHTISVQQVGATMTVSVDGSAVVTFTDTQNPYTSGSVALYCEDSTVNYAAPSITPLG